MKLLSSRARLRRSLKRAQEALDATPWLGYDMAEGLPELEGWLDGVTSTLSDLAELKDEPDTIDGVIDAVKTRVEFSKLVDVREQAAELYEYASCVAYGVCILREDALVDAADCFADVQGAIEKVLAGIRQASEGSR